MRLKKAAALAALLLVSTMLSLVLAEGLARVLSPFPEKYDRLWMLGSPTFQTDHGGAVRYVPNQTGRSVILQGGDIVYDVRFHTNDLGFIDHEDYSSDGERPADHARPLVDEAGVRFTARASEFLLDAVARHRLGLEGLENLALPVGCDAS